MSAKHAENSKTAHARTKRPRLEVWVLHCGFAYGYAYFE